MKDIRCGRHVTRSQELVHHIQQQVLEPRTRSQVQEERSRHRSRRRCRSWPACGCGRVQEQVRQQHVCQLSGAAGSRPLQRNTSLLMAPPRAYHAPTAPLSSTAGMFNMRHGTSTAWVSQRLTHEGSVSEQETPIPSLLFFCVPSSFSSSFQSLFSCSLSPFSDVSLIWVSVCHLLCSHTLWFSIVVLCGQFSNTCCSSLQHFFALIGEGGIQVPHAFVLGPLIFPPSILICTSLHWCH